LAKGASYRPQAAHSSDIKSFRIVQCTNVARLAISAAVACEHDFALRNEHDFAFAMTGRFESLLRRALLRRLEIGEECAPSMQSGDGEAFL
jgi:hypothetical protein